MAIRETYKQMSPAEFFRKYIHTAGFDNPTRALFQTVRELIENSLDATETYGILPHIKLEVEELSGRRVRIKVSDNGIGIPLDEVPNVYGRVFYGSKYIVRQTRGLFGLGVKMVVLYSQRTTGEPVRVRTSMPGFPVTYEFSVRIDVEKNIPIVTDVRVVKKVWWRCRDCGTFYRSSVKPERCVECGSTNIAASPGPRKEDTPFIDEHGTIVEVCIEGDWGNARSYVRRYLDMLAIIAPYATIEARGPKLELKYERVTSTLPKPPKVGKPHPLGIDLETLKMMISEARDEDPSITIKDFLCKYFDRVGDITAREFLKFAGIKPDTPLITFTDEMIKELFDKMRSFKWPRPSSKALSPVGEPGYIGEDHPLAVGLKRVFRAEYAVGVTRQPHVYGGHPFIVEVAVAYGGKISASDGPLIIRFANKIPLIYNPGEDVSRAVVKEFNWSHYKVKSEHLNKMAVAVHVCSTQVPYAGLDKEAIADVPEIRNEIKLALQKVMPKVRSYILAEEKKKEVIRRRSVFEKYIPEVSSALAYILNIKDEEPVKSKLLELMAKKLTSLSGGRHAGATAG